MMGIAMWSTDTPLSKGTNAILALSDKFDNAQDTPYSCLHCGKCLTVCPMHLMPLYIARYSEIRNYGECEKFNALSCVECGSCGYICPGKVPLVQLIRLAKATINEEKRAKAARQKEKEEKK